MMLSSVLDEPALHGEAASGMTESRWQEARQRTDHAMPTAGGPERQHPLSVEAKGVHTRGW